jgi:hypothetical protein
MQGPTDEASVPTTYVIDSRILGVTVPALPPPPLPAPAAPLASAAASRAPRRWKVEEDAKLIEAVKKHGNDWFAVAAMVPGRTNVQCRYRWVNYLAPDHASNAVEEDADRR